MFKFSIRDVFWLVLTIGLALGWFVSYRRAMSEHKALREEYANFYKITDFVQRFPNGTVAIDFENGFPIGKRLNQEMNEGLIPPNMQTIYTPKGP